MKNTDSICFLFFSFYNQLHIQELVFFLSTNEKMSILSNAQRFILAKISTFTGQMKRNILYYSESVQGLHSQSSGIMDTLCPLQATIYKAIVRCVIWRNVSPGSHICGEWVCNKCTASFVRGCNRARPLCHRPLAAAREK